MKKFRKLLILAGVLMVFSLTAFAQDGSASCTFSTSAGSTGAGYLTVNSARATGITTLPEGVGRAGVSVQVSYKTSSGIYTPGSQSATASQSVTKYINFPSGSSNRKGTSDHYQADWAHANVGHCSLWR